MDLIAPCVCFDRSRHSCVVIRITDRKIFAIPMTSSGLELVAMPLSAFKESRDIRTGEICKPDWMPSDYPVGRAAAHYLASGTVIPISLSARQQLEQLTSPLDIAPAAVEAAARAFVNNEQRLASKAQSEPSSTSKEIENMATAKKTVEKKPTAADKKAPKKSAPAKVVEAPKTAGRKPGVTSFIKECLLKGLANEEICMEISSKFPASKAGTKEISWCRSQLKKEGAL